MFRIRRIYDDTLMVNQHAIAEVQQILREQFELISESEINSLPDKLNNPFKYRFRSILFVMDDTHGNVKGFALLMHAPDLNFCYLDYISASKKEVGQGVGGALYERVRQEALALGCIGIFMECLPDDPALSRDAQIRKQNIARLRFYERYGARPIINTAYETPLKPGDDNPPYLVFDDLGQNKPLSRKNAREIVRAILERKYGDLCPKAYIEMVVNSFQDDPVQLRPPKYIKEPAREVSQNIPDDMRILLLVNDKHGIHHIRERGYVESPVRIDSILKEIRKTDYFQQTEARCFPKSTFVKFTIQTIWIILKRSVKNCPRANRFTHTSSRFATLRVPRRSWRFARAIIASIRLPRSMPTPILPLKARLIAH